MNGTYGPFMVAYLSLMPFLVIWTIIWKAWALWIAARKNQKIWFGVLLVINLLGILEILYIFIFSKKTKEGKKSFSVEEAKVIGDKLGIKWDKWDVNQFRMGLDVELEHGTRDQSTNVTNDDPALTGKIALAHLNEIRDYYDRLEKLEKEGEAYWEGKK